VTVAVLLVVLLLAWQSTRDALAHATLLRSDPAFGGSFATEPEAVTLWFSEPVEPEYSRVTVVRPDGSRLLAGELERVRDSPDPALRLPLPEQPGPGSYTVAWSVLSSVDGHVSEGYFSFTVGDALLPSPVAEAALARDASRRGAVPVAVDATARWLNLLGQGIIAGAVIFLLLVLLPVGGGIPARRWRWLFGGAGALLAGGHLTSALVQALNATGAGLSSTVDGQLLTLLADTRYGTLWLSRAVLLAALGLLLWWLTRGDRLLPVAGRGQLLWNAAGMVSALVLATTSLGSHAAAGSGSGSPAVLNDWLHLLAMSIWAGGLVGLVVALPGIGSPRALLARFSALSLGAVALLAVTGLIAARREVVGWDGIVATRYGMWLTLKLALVAAALGFGAWHLLVVRPAMGAAAPGHVIRGLRRTLRLEALLVVGVVGVAALMTATVPARDLLEGDASVFGATQLMPEASVTFRASPGRIGTNELSVVVSPTDPDAFGTLQEVSLQLVEPDGQFTPRVRLRQSGPNDPYTFRTTGAYLSRAGDWQLTVVLERAGLPSLDAAFDLTATGDGLRPTGVPASAAGDESISPRAVLLGGVWLLAALGLVAGAWWIRRERRSLSWGLLALALVALVTGSLLIVAGSAAAGG
jgi:copper transport protein